ncbi:MAG: hypothetical protein WC906_05570, partial [Parcubacteria group bacterium]
MNFNDKILQTKKNVTKEEQKELIFNNLIKNDSMKYNFELFKSNWEPLQCTQLLPAGSRSGENHPMRGSFSFLTDEIYIPDNYIQNINYKIKVENNNFSERLQGQIHVWDFRRYTRIYNDEDKSLDNLIYKGYGTNPLYPDISAGTINAISVINPNEANTEVVYPGNWWAKGDNIEDYQYYNYLTGPGVTEDTPSSESTDGNGVITTIFGPYKINWQMANISNINSSSVTGIAKYTNRIETKVRVAGTKTFVGLPVPHYEITPTIDDFIVENPLYGGVISVLVRYHPEDSLLYYEEHTSFDENGKIIFNYELGVPGYIEVNYASIDSTVGSVTVQHTDIDELSTYRLDTSGNPVESIYHNPESWVFDG